MLNPELIKIYGEESKPLFNQLLTELSEELAPLCYMSTKGSIKLDNGARMPVSMITDSDRVEDVKNNIRGFWKKHPLMGVYNVDKISHGFVPLQVKDRGEIVMELNPELVKIYGEESRVILESLIHELGDELAPLCYAPKEGYVNVGSVMLPVSIVTESTLVNEIHKKMAEFKRMYPYITVRRIGRIPADFVKLCIVHEKKTQVDQKVDDMINSESQKSIDEDYAGDTVKNGVFNPAVTMSGE